MGLLIRTTPTLEAYIDSWRLRGGQVMVVANPGGWPAVKLPLICDCRLTALSVTRRVLRVCTTQYLFSTRWLTGPYYSLSRGDRVLDLQSAPRFPAGLDLRWQRTDAVAMSGSTLRQRRLAGGTRVEYSCGLRRIQICRWSPDTGPISLIELPDHLRPVMVPINRQRPSDGPLTSRHLVPGRRDKRLRGVQKRHGNARPCWFIHGDSYNQLVVYFIGNKP